MSSICVLGAGASLNKFDVDYFRNKTVIGVNSVIEKYFDVLNYYILIDANSHCEWIEKARQLGKEKFYCYSRIAEKYNITENEATIFERASGEHFYTKKEKPLKLATGFTVVFCAVNLAILLDYTEITLYGCDFCYSKNKEHYNDKQNITKYENDLTRIKIKSNKQITTQSGYTYYASEFHHKMRMCLKNAIKRIKGVIFKNVSESII